MTLIQIISSALEQLGHTTDSQTQEEGRNKFTQLANEGMFDLGAAIKLRRTDELTVDDNGEIDITGLPYICSKIISVKQGDTSVNFNRGSGTYSIKVDAAGTVQVEYYYLPKEMSSDTDVPGIPANLHHLIVLFITAREHSTANVDTQNRYNALYNMYRDGKAQAARHYGEPENYTVTGAPDWSGF